MSPTAIVPAHKHTVTHEWSSIRGVGVSVHTDLSRSGKVGKDHHAASIDDLFHYGVVVVYVEAVITSAFDCAVLEDELTTKSCQMDPIYVAASITTILLDNVAVGHCEVLSDFCEEGHSWA